MWAIAKHTWCQCYIIKITTKKKLVNNVNDYRVAEEDAIECNKDWDTIEQNATHNKKPDTFPKH